MIRLRDLAALALIVGSPFLAWTSCHRKFDGAGDLPRNPAGQFLPATSEHPVGATITIQELRRC